MRSNPFLGAYWKRRSNAWSSTGTAAIVARWVLPIVAAFVLVGLVRPIFLSWLDLPADRWAEGLAGTLLRASIVCVGWLSLDVYSAVIRGPDRAVLDIYPVDPAKVVAFELFRVALERWWLVPLLALLTVPVALEADPLLWGLGVVVIAGAWCLGLAVSGMVHLLAIDVSEDPRWADFLDLVRGSNPRAQAAFIYAPGAALLIAGLLVSQASQAAPRVFAGELAGLVWLVLPFVASGLALVPVPRLADRSWFRASTVLADIDARYAALTDREEGLRVYLDWTVRWLPSRVALYATKDLRHGWRARRTPIMGAWVCGLAAFAAGWSEAATAPSRAAAVAVGGAFLCAVVAVLLERDEPEFLRAWLPVETGPRVGGRLWALFGWLQPTVWMPVVAVALRRGLADAGLVLGVGEGALLLAAVVAVICGRRGGLLVYAPVATLTAATLAALLVVEAP